MVSEGYQNMENNIQRNKEVYGELIADIGRKLNKSPITINGVIQRTSIGLGNRPIEIALEINEFLTIMQEEE